MSASVLNPKHFATESAAYEWVESRVWPNGPVCSHCGGSTRISKMNGKSTRIGLYKCYQCRKNFRVTVGTIFQASHVSLNLWLQAMYLMALSKNDISPSELHRTLGVTFHTAQFMCHRLREVKSDHAVDLLGGEGDFAGADETYSDETETLPFTR